VRIENEVLQMHNRINLLEQEERRALKRIEETRSKADKILQNRQETLEF
jgi:predicted ribosome quality control (RQC) complex YloA/Tae2 family protein